MSQNHRIALTIEAQSKGEDKLKSMTDALDGMGQEAAALKDQASQVSAELQRFHG